MIDLEKPLFIVAKVQDGRLAVLGGGNDERQARLLAAMGRGLVLLRAEAVPNNGLSEDGE